MRATPADLDHRTPLERVPWWLRAMASLPLPAWYRISDCFAWLAEHVFHYRRGLVNAQLQRSFPDKDSAWITATRRSFYRNFGDVSCEIIKAVSISREEIAERIRFVDEGPARAALESGQSIVVSTSHNCNWEWTLLALSIGMGHPVDCAYKPLRGEWGDRAFLTIRSRFGARMIPAGKLLFRVLRQRGQARLVAIAADQNPEASSACHFTEFFGQHTAFYIGPEAIARIAKMPVYYLAMRRESRGHYSVTFEPLVAAGEPLAEGAVIERYARRIEALTRERPADWLWSYRRWKVRRPRPSGDRVASTAANPGSD